MTPEDLRALAGVMRELGVFKLTLPDGICVEMSQAAILAGQSEKLAREAPAKVDEAKADDERPKKQDEDALLYAATEGLPD
jgi:hypothetical protein